MTIARNPSFTPSPKLRDYLNSSPLGVTAALNDLFDHFQLSMELDAIRLTPDEQAALKEMLMGVYIDNVAIQSVPQDLEETDNEGLKKKLKGAGYAQVLATLKRYGITES